MKKLTTEQKIKIGGRLARVFGLKLDERTGLYSMDGRPTSALNVFEAAQEICCQHHCQPDSVPLNRRAE